MAIVSILVQMVAPSIGLGSCWIQVRNRVFNDQTTSEQYVQNLLGISEHTKVQLIIAIGYPAEQRGPLPAEEIKYRKIRMNTYGG
jgi:nitroreductase